MPVVVRIGPKRLEFSASVARDGSLCAEGRDSLDAGEGWTSEHLVLAALARCSLASLRHHAGRAGLDLAGVAVASGLVTKRESDGRYAFVELQCGLDVELDPAPANVSELVARAERGCFIGASLTAPVEYEWRVNGELVPRPR
jgi:organic hydroperoxide reductase OsmC/OhrA